MYDNRTITVAVNIPAKSIGVNVAGQSKNMATRIEKGNCPHTPYEGSYVFTPGATAQIVPTKDRVLLDNIRINPIPSNYGLVTYNGSTITVS